MTVQSGLARIPIRSVGRAFGSAAAVMAVLVVTGLDLPLPYSDGPEPAYTGGFGEATCHRCHTGNPLNDVGTRVTVDVPTDYHSGRSYRVTIRVGRESMKAAGFQLSARVARGASAGSQAGHLKPNDDRVQVVLDDASGVQYASHNEAASSGGSSEVSWSLTWTAPVCGQPVILHVAANAANGDDSELGDHIATDSTLVSYAGEIGPDCPAGPLDNEGSK